MLHTEQELIKSCPVLDTFHVFSNKLLLNKAYLYSLKECDMYKIHTLKEDLDKF